MSPQPAASRSSARWEVRCATHWLRRGIRCTLSAADGDGQEGDGEGTGANPPDLPLIQRDLITCNRSSSEQNSSTARGHRRSPIARRRQTGIVRGVNVVFHMSLAVDFGEKRARPGGEARRRLAGGSREARGRLAGGSQEVRRRLAGGSREARRRLAGGSREARRRLAGGSREARGRLTGGSQEARRRLAGGSRGAAGWKLPPRQRLASSLSG